MTAIPHLPSETMWSLLSQLRSVEDTTRVRLCLMEIADGENIAWHEELHELASRLAKIGPAEALALVMVYDRLGIFSPPSDSGKERAEALASDMNRLLGEVTGWAAVVKARRYHARLKDWVAAKPKAPRSVRARRKGGAL